MDEVNLQQNILELGEPLYPDAFKRACVLFGSLFDKFKTEIEDNVGDETGVKIHTPNNDEMIKLLVESTKDATEQADGNLIAKVAINILYLLFFV